jgi:ribonuclease HI
MESSCGAQQERRKEDARKECVENKVNYEKLPDSQIGGRLCKFVSNWKKLTSDRFILDIVQGLKIKFDKDVVTYFRSPLIFSQSEKCIMISEIEKLLAKGVIVKSQHEDGEIVSNVFLRKKKDGKKYRMILNLKPLNEYVEYKHFKMDSLENAKYLVKPECFMASIDLSDAYFCVPMLKSHRKFVKFMYDGVLYEFVGMPQGLSCAPRIFTKLLKPFYAEMSSLGHVCMGYIDDSIIVGDTIDECRDAVTVMSPKLTELGFVLNREKSILEPVQSLEFLGYVIDSVDMNLSLPNSKVECIVHLCNELIQDQKCTIKRLAEIIGTMNAYCSGVEFGRLHCRNLEIFKNVSLRCNSGNFSAMVNIPGNCIRDCEWWRDEAKLHKKLIDHGNPDIILYTDASSGGNAGIGGWGAKRGDQSTGGRWSIDEQQNDINFLEILACFLGLQSLCKYEKNVHIQIKCDNTCAVSYINNMGGTKSLKCNEMAYKIWKWAMKYGNWISATYVPSAENVADEKSRIFHDATEWKLNEEVFVSLCELWGKPDVDLFASRLNNQVECYVSWEPDPNAVHVDAFSMAWSYSLCYIFPPFSCLMRTVWKIVADKSEAVVVAPNWRAQPWFMPLMKILVDRPVLLPRMERLLYLPYAQGKRHALQPQMMACRVSGNLSLHKDFLRKQLTLCCDLGEKAHKDNIRLTLTNGSDSVQSMVLINFVRL